MFQFLVVWWCDVGLLVDGGWKGEICIDFFFEERVLVLF